MQILSHLRTKTLASVLTSANALVQDLKDIVSINQHQAINKEVQAHDLQQAANDNWETAAHADIVANRVTGMLTISNEQLAQAVIEIKEQAD